MFLTSRLMNYWTTNTLVNQTLGEKKKTKKKYIATFFRLDNKKN